MSQTLSVEKTVGAYTLVVSGRPDDFELLVDMLDSAVEKMAKRGDIEESSTVPLRQRGISIPQLPGSLSLSNAVAELFASEWGKHPRKMTEIQEALAVNGINYPLTTLSGKLLKLTRRMVLRRFRDEKGDYVYTQGSVGVRISEED